jgi:O-antigen ligase
MTSRLATRVGLTSVLAVLAVAATVGSHMPLLGLSWLRILAVAMFLLTFARALAMPARRISVVLGLHIALIVFWFLQAVMATAILGANEAAIRELASITFGFILLLIPLLHGLRTEQLPRQISRFWVLAFMVALFFAVLELMTGQKLESNFTETQPEHVFEQLFLVSTFDNPNNYAVFLLLCLPFLMIELACALSKSAKAFLVLMVLTLLVQIVLTASRAAIMGALAFLLIWTAFRLGGRVVVLFTCAAALLAAALAAYAEKLGLESLSIFLKLISSVEDLEYGSSRERYNIFLNSWQIILAHPLFGVGPGQFAQYLSRDHLIYPIEVPNPHSMFLEVFTQYGVVTFSLFVVCIAAIGVSAWRVLRSSGFGTDAAKVSCAVVSAIPLYLIALNINSTYMSLQFCWIFLGSLAALSVFLRLRQASNS